MLLTSVMLNGGNTIIELVMLCRVAYGTWRYGFLALFNQRLGRIVMTLG